uniref:TNF receptor-associated protein 1 n=1 Tax=Sinocyclocheilus grahami TaxID=75366 RepID=A0A672S4N9_SINGR
MIRSLSSLKYSLNVCQRAHVRLLSSSRGVGERIVPATFTGGTCFICLTWMSQIRTHPISRDTENIQGSYSKHEFQAETKKLLDIVARSLYSEKEVFIRELISNSSDALEKLRHKMITAGGDTAPMEIHLQTDAAKGTFTIQVPSTHTAFLDALQNQAEASSSIIGQFGVGFYSAFMVADKVDVYSQSLTDDSLFCFAMIVNVGEQKPSMLDVSREMGSSVALYSRKVLIQTKATDILPKWLRFLALIRKLRDVLQQRVIQFPLDQSKKDPEKYARFFDDYGLFMREGIVATAEQSVKEDIAKLLRFESSALPAGQQTSLMEYASRMKAGTRNIYYLCAPNRHLAEQSPYFEAMKQKDMEVLFCFEQFDELTLLHLREFDRKKLISVETNIVVDHYKEEKFHDSKPGKTLNALGQRVTNIKVTPRLDTPPAMITVLEMGAARHFLRTQQLARSSEERAQILQPTLEINTGYEMSFHHSLISILFLIKNPRPMISLLNQLLTQAQEKH